MRRSRQRYTFFGPTRWRRRRRRGIMKERRSPVPRAATRTGAPGTIDTIGRLMHSDNERAKGAMHAMRFLPPPAAWPERSRGLWGAALLAVAVLLTTGRGA